MRAAFWTVLTLGAAALVVEIVQHDAGPVTWLHGTAWGVAAFVLARLLAREQTRRADVGALEGRIAELIRIEHRSARTDPLTSLCNRRAFVDALQQAEARSRRSGGALAVARLDVDGFRALNETYSRADGDQLLRAIATSLSLATRMGDLASRLENDEFAVLLYGCSPQDARRVGQRLVKEVADLGRAYPETPISASIGIACFAGPGADPDEMMRAAGAALQRVRNEGGGDVQIHS